MQNLKDLMSIFVEKELIDESKVEEVIKLTEEENLTLDQCLVQHRYIPEMPLLQAMSDYLGYELREKLEGIKVPKSFCEKVPINFARNSSLIAIDEKHGFYYIATCTPLLTYPLDELASLLDSEVEIILAPRTEILALINQAYQQHMSDGNAVDEMEEDFDLDGIGEFEERFDIAESQNKPPVIRTVNNILLQALRKKVSDIHLQPYEEKLQVRYRIDGILYDVQSIPKRYQDAVVSRIKVMGRMDIAEKRLPQDGRTSIVMGTKEVDLRISSLPVVSGERIVMRILDKSNKVFRLDDIGLDERDLKVLNHFIQYNHGIILVTGPTGSGKSTTLYACLAGLNAVEKNIVTVENPVEYQMRGISQTQVAVKKGLTFAKTLKTLLRQDPDVIMIGEIRDEETGRIAIQAAQTGHLVLSTIHTNDSASTITRLLDIGIEPYMVSSSLVCAMAQRLMRRICDDCKTEYKPSEAKLKSVGLDFNDLPHGVLWQGKGCEQCMGSGYKGRCGVYEVLPITEKIKAKIVERASASEIKQECVERGLRTLRMDGAAKAAKGWTTIDEVLRVTQMDLF
ncbi:GspE/PulE family protein [Candidatus Uabimicrobium amorphum]|uniref:Type II secretion system protein GspE n=1 Tax=Uabimicrobium amorphum TaxID=2596890 RepID=A0A5S9IU46_UABAM|nr:ATPase, T2SS/T4P/T4SS family [Candidatus Uabimicrobium amorphum]BBM87807.1 type II secretion system protein GspE [Candidatus Uabimicrobium amorphum]